MEEIWSEHAQDMRLWQFIDNCCITWYDEDNEAIQKMCNLFELEPAHYILWGTRWKDWKDKLEFKRLSTLETSHLTSIMNDHNEKLYAVSVLILNSIYVILKERWEEYGK